MMVNQPPPPPAYPMPTPQPVGFGQPPQPVAFGQPPQPIGFGQPPPPTVPLNAADYQMPSPQYVYPTGGPYGADPLIQEQTRIAALNATPRSYYPSRFSRVNQKVAMITIGVIFLMFIVVFFIIYFVHTRSNQQFEEAVKLHEDYRNKNFW